MFDFSLGEPDFNTPEHICEAADDGDARRAHALHRPPAASPELQGRHLPAGTRRLTASTAAPRRSSSPTAPSTRIHNALAATVGPGDEVIIPTPVLGQLHRPREMTGATPVLVPTTAAERVQDVARATRRRRSRRARAC